MSNDLRFRALLEDHVSSSLDRIKDSLDRVGGKGTAQTAFGFAAVKGLDLIADGAYKAGQAIGDFIGDSLDAASDLNETLAKSQVVFGASAADVERWGETAADAFGLSKQAAIEAAASFGNVFKGLDIPAQKSAEMSRRLVELAGDLASFNNLDPTEALEKLRSGLAGEAEPLRSVGVFLSEAQVKAKAMELGLVGAHGELSEGSKILARYQLILDQTKTAQGDFARTSDGVANSQRKVNAEIENQKAALGEELLPAEKLWLDIQLNLFKGANALADTLSGKVTPATIGTAVAHGHLAEAIAYVRPRLHELDEQTLQSATVAGIFTIAERDAELAARRHAEAVKFMADHVKDDLERVTPAAVDDLTKIGGGMTGIGWAANKAEDQVSAALEQIVADVRAAKDALEAAGSEAGAALYDPQIAAAELYKNTRELKEVEANLKSGKLRGEELADAKIRWAELRKERINLLTTLAEAGDANAKKELRNIAATVLSSKNASRDQKTYWQGVIDKLNLLDGAVVDLNADLKRLSWQAGHTKDDVAQIPGLGSHNSGSTQFASGGTLPGPGIYTVGEDRAETLVLSGSGQGYVLPQASSGRDGGGQMQRVTRVIQIVLDGRVVAEAVDEENYWASAIAGGSPSQA